MCECNFETKVIGYKRNQSKLIKNHILNSIVLKIYFIIACFKIPKSNCNSTDVLFLLSTNPFLFLLVRGIAIVKNYKLLAERNEYPEKIRRGIKWKAWIYNVTVVWWQYRLIDGLFVMTDELIRFYSSHTKKKCVIQKLPMTVDFSRFDFDTKRIDETPYIFYAGSFSQDKDGVQSLIKAFRTVVKEIQEWELWLAGGKRQSNEMKGIITLINSLGLSTKVKLLGNLDRNEIPFYLKNSKLLVLPRPDSIQARGGFPTKLGEYLASGIPVIATNVGEIPQYLSEKEVFLISPINIEEELADRIREVYDNYDLALTKAAMARKKAFSNFSTEANSIKVKELINKLA